MIWSWPYLRSRFRIRKENGPLPWFIVSARFNGWSTRKFLQISRPFCFLISFQNYVIPGRNGYRPLILDQSAYNWSLWYALFFKVVITICKRGKAEFRQIWRIRNAGICDHRERTGWTKNQTLRCKGMQQFQIVKIFAEFMQRAIANCLLTGTFRFFLCLGGDEEGLKILRDRNLWGRSTLKWLSRE